MKRKHLGSLNFSTAEPRKLGPQGLRSSWQATISLASIEPTYGSLLSLRQGGLAASSPNNMQHVSTPRRSVIASSGTNVLGWWLRRVAAAVLVAMSAWMPARSMVLLASAEVPTLTGSHSETATSVGFAFHYMFSGELADCAGCHPALQLPKDGALIFDFTRETEGSILFDGLVARLTDSQNEVVLVSMLFFDSEGHLFGGIGSGDTEQALFGKLPLPGSSIELVRLTIDVQEMRFIRAGGVFDARIDLFGELPNAVISEPTTGLLVVLGIVLLWFDHSVGRQSRPRRVLQE